MDYNKICEPPRLDDFKQIADETRIKNNIPTIVSPKMLYKRNIELEARDKKINILNINSMVNNDWNNRLTNAQRKGFEALSKKINDYNQDIANVNEDSRNTMIRINNHQEIDLTLGVAIFGGTDQFHEQNDFEAYILTPFPY
jgi:hypothetical protein